MNRWADDRGSLSLFAIVIGVALLGMVGLVVDGGGKIRATQRADATAAEAARAGGQAINESAAVRGLDPTANPVRARAAAEDVLDRAGVDGTVTVTDGGTRIQVDTEERYRPVFLNIIGVDNMVVTGHATAGLVSRVEAP